MHFGSWHVRSICIHLQKCMTYARCVHEPCTVLHDCMLRICHDPKNTWCSMPSMRLWCVYECYTSGPPAGPIATRAARGRAGRRPGWPGEEGGGGQTRSGQSRMDSINHAFWILTCTQHVLMQRNCMSPADFLHKSRIFEHEGMPGRR